MDRELPISKEDARLLLAAGNGDAALLYLATKAGLPSRLSPPRAAAAMSVLQQLGFQQSPEIPAPSTDKPTYSAETVRQELGKPEFQKLLGEVQRILGRIIPTEELRSLLCIREYLQMPDDVTVILTNYCVRRNCAAGRRAPSLREIEREAFSWSDLNIDTVDVAVRWMQMLLNRQSRRGQIARLLQISGRTLIKSEVEYLDRWIGWGFPDDVIALAYEKSCMNVGGLRWQYMNSILKSWQEQKLLTVADIQKNDKGGKQKPAPRRRTGTLEQEAIQRILEED